MARGVQNGAKIDKNLSKMRGLRDTFSTLLRICEKCDLEQPPSFLLYFSTLKASIFDLKRYIFSCFFEAALKTCIFPILGRFFVLLGGQMGAKIDKKSIKNEADFLMIF